MSNSIHFFKAILIGILALSVNHVSFGQVEEKVKKNALKLSPSAFAVSTFALSYERHIASGFTIQLTGGIMAASKKSNNYGYNNGTSYQYTKDEASGGFVEGMFKYYFLKGQSAMSGLYAAPYYRYTKNDFDIHTTNSNGIAVNYKLEYSIRSEEGGAVFGWQCVIKNAFVMDMFVGGGLKKSSNSAPATYDRGNRTFWILEAQDNTGIVPKAGFRLGFVF
jgi:hypothetical protein